MTPSTTFQWPLSPSGTFQPVRSWPLKIGVNPSGGSAAAMRDSASAATTSRAKWRISSFRGLGVSPERFSRADGRSKRSGEMPKPRKSLLLLLFQHLLRAADLLEGLQVRPERARAGEDELEVLGLEALRE